MNARTLMASAPVTPGSSLGGRIRGRVIKDGWMEKKGALVKKWRRRYFVLYCDTRELRYYDGERLRGIINLDQVQAVCKSTQPWSRSLDHCYSFELHTAKRVYYISCDSEEELLSWMSEIRKLLTFARGGVVNGTTSSTLPVVRATRSGSVEGAESGAEGDLTSSGSGTSVSSQLVNNGSCILLVKQEVEELSESEGEDEPDIVPESNEQPAVSSASTHNHDEVDNQGQSRSSALSGLSSSQKLPTVKAIIAGSLLECQNKLEEERRNLHSRGQSMSKDEIVMLIRRLKALTEAVVSPTAPRNQ